MKIARICHSRRLSSTSLIEDLNRESSVVLFTDEEKSKNPGSSISFSVIPAEAGIQAWFLWRVRRKKKNPWILVDCLDPFFDWIPDQVGDKRRG